MTAGAAGQGWRRAEPAVGRLAREMRVICARTAARRKSLSGAPAWHRSEYAALWRVHPHSPHGVREPDVPREPDQCSSAPMSGVVSRGVPK